jgi:hypothetical protein
MTDLLSLRSGQWITTDRPGATRGAARTGRAGYAAQRGFVQLDASSGLRLAVLYNFV